MGDIRENDGEKVEEDEWKVYYFPLMFENIGLEGENNERHGGNDCSYRKPCNNNERCDDKNKAEEASRGNKDPIYVIPFGEGGTTGLITYVKHQISSGNSTRTEQTRGVCATENERGMCRDSPINEKGDCRYVHTLNSMSGFQRKLEAIGIVLTEEFLVLESGN